MPPADPHRFFGKDILRISDANERALLSNCIHVAWTCGS
jgi:hypothetical protein